MHPAELGQPGHQLIEPRGGIGVVARRAAGRVGDVVADGGLGHVALRPGVPHEHVAEAAVLAAAQRLAAPGSQAQGAGSGSLYNVAGPEPIPSGELLRACARAVGSRTRLLPVPLAPLVSLARGYERLSRHPRLRAEHLLRLGEDKAFAIGDTIRDLGYAPRPFADGIAGEARLPGLAG